MHERTMRLEGMPTIGVDAMGAAADAARDPAILRLENLDTDLRPPEAALAAIVTAGGLNGCLVTLNALVNPGDEVVVTDPTYVGMLNRIRIAMGRPVQVPYVWTGVAWQLDLDRLKAAIGTRTRALFLMNPSMPSGAVLSEEAWSVVAELCQEHDLWLIYNAAMERILYDRRRYLHPASLPGMRARTLTIGSVSKEYRMIGWRVGWVVGPET
ncbi:MAG: pyridoxal phosphate-dependent aminotransferase, partial [Gammaproteobacteria bacterium]